MSRLFILSVCLVWVALSPHVFALSEPACRPCRSSDGAQCTHPGNANRMWCAMRCFGINTDSCPASHCFCEGDSVPGPEKCHPCQANDTQNPQCTHPGVANQAWCNARCTKGVNTATCPASHCTCVQENATNAKVQVQEQQQNTQEASQKKAQTLAAKSIKQLPSKTSQKRDKLLPYISVIAGGLVIAIAAALFASAKHAQGTAVQDQHPGYAGIMAEDPQRAPRARNVAKFPILV